MTTKEEELKVILSRIMTGITGSDVGNCKWYEGILDDAKDEAREILNPDRTKEEKIIDWIRAELSDCWSSQIVGYDAHKCNGQDGKDISFTKKTFESVFERAKEKFMR